MTTTTRRPRKLTPEKIAEVRALADKKLPQRDIARRTGLSKGTVASLLATVPQDAPAAPPPPSAPHDADEAPLDPSPEARLQRAAAHLEHACAEARHDRDTSRLIAASRAAAQVAVLVAKLPRPEPTTDERAETIANAKLARAKLHDLFSRLLAEPA